MDAIALLKAEHQAVEAKFAKYEQLGDRALKAKATIVADVVKALSAHAAIEEEVFYPAVRERLADQEDQVLEALEEHHVLKWTLSELDGMSPEQERFNAKFTVLMESVRHHVKEEEKELFPRVRKGFTRGELVELGDALAKAKLRAPKKPHPRSPDSPPMNVLMASLTNPMDHAISSAHDMGEAAMRKLRTTVGSGN
jgi:hemerythrin superfamily protein